MGRHPFLDYTVGNGWEKIRCFTQNVMAMVGKRSAVLLANHGPVVAGKNLESAANAIEELENTAKLALILSGQKPRLLNNKNVNDVINKFKI